MAKPLRITLEAARVNAGYKQKDIAEKLGVSKKTISNWELGRTTPNTTLLIQMLDDYGLEFDDIIMPKDSPLREKEVET